MWCIEEESRTEKGYCVFVRSGEASRGGLENIRADSDSVASVYPGEIEPGKWSMECPSSAYDVRTAVTVKG